MRYAICFSGQPRYLEAGFKSLNEFLFEPNGGIQNFDIFVHCWYDSSKIGQKFDCAPWNSDSIQTIDYDLDKKIIEMYEPKKYFFEPEKQWWLPRTYTYKGDQPSYIPYSMFYSVYMANTLKRIYEQENGFIYDLVIRSRFDLGLTRNLTCFYFNADSVTLHNNCQTVKGATPGSFNDWFAVMNSKNADIYADTFFHIDEFYCEGVKHTQECTLGRQFIKNKVIVRPYDLGCYLIRKENYGTNN